MNGVELISNLGFPIACVLGMGYFIIYLMRIHKEEMDKVTEALNNNTKALNQILEHIRK